MSQEHDTCENCTELQGEIDELQEQMTKFRRRLNDVDDWREFMASNRVPGVEDDTDALRKRVDELAAEVTTLENQMETFTGIAEDERSTPAKRAADLRSAMIRAARSSSRDGVKWWKDEIEEHLAALGHEDLHKPDLYDAMESATDADGFKETSKHVRKNGREMEVRAIRLNLDELPVSEHGREITTGEQAEGNAQPAQTTAELD